MFNLFNLFAFLNFDDLCKYNYQPYLKFVITLGNIALRAT